jgi:hypothetical protein
MLKNDRAVQKDGPQVFELRGYFVMLAADVARIFEVETRIIVQNIKRNNIGIRPLFPEHYAFLINTKELEYLRSLGVISKPRRGGTRVLPWVITRKGAIRLVTIMKVPTALEAADVFVDIFDEVLTQVFQGKDIIRASNPSRIVPSEEQLSHANKKIDIAERLLVMHNKLEPNSIVKMVGQFFTHQPKLES